MALPAGLGQCFVNMFLLSTCASPGAHMQLCLLCLQQQQVSGSRRPSDFGGDSQLSSLRASESGEINHPLQTPLAAQLSQILEGDELQRTLGRVSKAAAASVA